MHSTQKIRGRSGPTVLHAGGKFEQGAYTVSGGLHGVGISVVNALSEWLELEIWQDGQVFESNATSAESPRRPGRHRQNQTPRHQGALQSPTARYSETLEFSFGVLAQRLRELAFSTKAWRSRSGRPAKKGTGLPLQGRHRLLRRSPQRGETPLQSRFTCKRNGPTSSWKWRCNTTTGYAENLFSFANNINTKEGGTHLVGFKAALTRTINSYANANDLPQRRIRNR